MSGRTLFIVLLRVAGIYVVASIVGAAAAMLGHALIGSGSDLQLWMIGAVIAEIAIGVWLCRAAPWVADRFAWPKDGADSAERSSDESLPSVSLRIAARAVALVAILEGLFPLSRLISGLIDRGASDSHWPEALELAAYSIAAIVLLNLSRERRKRLAS